MNEMRWLTGDDPRPMLDHLGPAASRRKLRLFAVACVRRCPPGRFTLSESGIVEAVEAHADGGGPLPDPGSLPTKERAIVALIRRDAAGAARMTAGETAGDGSAERDAGRAAQSALLREIFGNPFHSVNFDPAWRTPEVVALAREIYEDRAVERLPALADALQAVGCDNADLLDHLRVGRPHVRGCWAIDPCWGTSDGWPNSAAVVGFDHLRDRIRTGSARSRRTACRFDHFPHGFGVG
jgi:hypothetical protein